MCSSQNSPRVEMPVASRGLLSESLHGTSRSKQGGSHTELKTLLLARQRTEQGQNQGLCACCDGTRLQLPHIHSMQPCLLLARALIPT